jgi:type I restriction enzyme S subunit
MYKRLEGSVRLCLTYESLCNIKIALPAIEEQETFVQQISAIVSQIDNEEKILIMYQSQKQYLLAQMFI